MKSLRTRLGAALLSAVLAVSVIVPAAAAPAAFTDVPSNAWYAQDVADVQKYGIINGVGSNRFAPDGVLTFTQAVAMAARTHAYMNGKTIPNDTGSHWAEATFDYAKQHGILYDDMIPANNPMCSRETMADLFYYVIDGQDNPVLNEIYEIPDYAPATSTSPVLFLYQYGILTGSDQYGTFYPDRSITRAETAAILNRLLDVDKRKTFKLEPGNYMLSIDHTAAWTLYEAYEYGDYTEYYNTTIAFMADGSMYGMYYIPDSGYMERFRGTYKLNGKNTALNGSWDDGTKFYGTYEVYAAPGGDGFMLKMLSGEGLYIGNEDYVIFNKDYGLTADQCKEKCLRYWGAEPQ